MVHGLAGTTGGLQMNRTMVRPGMVAPMAVSNSPSLDVLTFSTLYPNEARPEHGIFVENRLRHLRASGRVNGEVVAPSPWFPFEAAGFGRYASFARVPKLETRHGITIHHPRYP